MQIEKASSVSPSERKRAAAMLRLRVTDLLHAALKESGIKKAELSRTLKIDRSAVTQVIEGNGNITINTLADYLAALGYEVDLLPVELGEIVASMREHRSPRVQTITMRDCYRVSGRPLHIVYEVNSSREVPRLESAIGAANRNSSKSIHKWLGQLEEVKVSRK